MKKKSKEKPKQYTTHKTSCETSLRIVTNNTVSDEARQYFHMYFGFVRGSDYKIKNKTGPTITSTDGFNLYLTIVNRATRYTWIFLTTSKSPPINIVQRVLQNSKVPTNTAQCTPIKAANWENQPSSNK